MKKLHLVMTVALTAGFLTACQSTAGVPKESTEVLRIRMLRQYL